jgi:hypothetical protein
MVEVRFEVPPDARLPVHEVEGTRLATRLLSS